MSRHITTIFAAVAVAMGLSAGAVSGGTPPGKLPPANLTPPTISGTPQVGKALLADPGTWRRKKLQYAYRWLRCDSTGASCSAISGATASTISLSSAELGARMRVVVIASNHNGSVAATSDATAVVVSAPAPEPPPPPPPPPPSESPSTPPSVTSAPTVSGAPQEGQTLTASSGSWSGTSPITYAYEWQRCDTAGASCSSVASGIGTSYLLASTDVGSTMRVSVIASNSAGLATAFSAATAVVSALPAPTDDRVTYGKSFDDGLVVSSGWGAQDNTTVADTSGIHRGKITSDNTTSSGGSWSGRFDLPAYTSGRTAAELLHSRMADPGVDDYYAQAFQFNDYAWGPCDNQGLSLAQYNYEGINGSPLALSAQCGTGSGATATTLKSVFLLVNSGNCSTTSGCPYYSGGPVGGGYASRGMPEPGPYYILSPGNVQLNIWYQVVIHVRWTAGTDGVVEAWIKKKGDSSFTKVFSHSGGFPTLQWGGSNSISVGNLSSYGTNDKFGAYRGPDPNPLKLWQDSFCRATSFDAAASCVR